jgi:hypothetical protein
MFKYHLVFWDIKNIVMMFLMSTSSQNIKISYVQQPIVELVWSHLAQKE